jgi:RNA polymerase sigma-70 factor (ECF subfamily)
MTPGPDMEMLVKKAREGDRAAFEEALAAHESRLRGFVRTRLGSQLQGEIEVDDVLQETFAGAFASIGCFQWRGPASFLRWLNGIAEHVILSAVRKRRNRAGTVLFLDQDLPIKDPAPSKAARREERMERLQRALDGLSPEYREAIYLVRIEGLQVKEAASRMGRTAKSVMHLVSRGLEKLRGSFGDTESLSLPPKALRREDPSDER